jgi:hypothetical protein
MVRPGVRKGDAEACGREKRRHWHLAWSATVLYSLDEQFQYFVPTKANILSTLL